MDIVNNKIPRVSELVMLKSKASAIEYITMLADISGISKVATHTHLGVEVWRGLHKLSQDILKTHPEIIDNPAKLIELLISYKKSSERKNIKIKTGVNNAPVTILTAHSSKGLEYDYVFVPHATEDSWILKQKNNYFVFPKEKDEGDTIEFKLADCKANRKKYSPKKLREAQPCKVAWNNIKKIRLHLDV
jgi:ATP-dependent exoDNAse (exonuclease V) beta subunit